MYFTKSYLSTQFFSASNLCTSRAVGGPCSFWPPSISASSSSSVYSTHAHTVTHDNSVRFSTTQFRKQTCRITELIADQSLETNSLSEHVGRLQHCSCNSKNMHTHLSSAHKRLADFAIATTVARGDQVSNATTLEKRNVTYAFVKHAGKLDHFHHANADNSCFGIAAKPALASTQKPKYGSSISL